MKRTVLKQVSGALIIVVIAGALAFFALYPSRAQAFPFGGQISFIHLCYNQVIYVSVGPPRGGQFIWSRSTRTYQFGPPSHTGQWLLGLAGAPYFCLAYIQPVTTWPGALITMMGSSQ